MELIIILFGGLIIAGGILMLLKPDVIFDFLKRESDNLNLHIFAIAIRLVIGFLLIYYSGASGYPVVMESLGWFVIIAAIALILIGRNNFQHLIEWAITFLKPYHRVGGFLAVAFGVFLIYAFL